MDVKMNGLQINCPKKVAWFFFFFALFLIGKLWMKNILNFRLTVWKYLLFKNEKIWKKNPKKQQN